MLQNYNARLVLMLHITLWLWYTANGRLSVESREKRYTRGDRSLSSVRKVWVMQIKVQTCTVYESRYLEYAVPYVYSENGTGDLFAKKNSLKVFRAHRVKRVSFCSQ